MRASVQMSSKSAHCWCYCPTICVRRALMEACIDKEMSSCHQQCMRTSQISDRLYSQRANSYNTNDSNPAQISRLQAAMAVNVFCNDLHRGPTYWIFILAGWLAHNLRKIRLHKSSEKVALTWRSLRWDRRRWFSRGRQAVWRLSSVTEVGALTTSTELLPTRHLTLCANVRAAWCASKVKRVVRNAWSCALQSVSSETASRSLCLACRPCVLARAASTAHT